MTTPTAAALKFWGFGVGVGGFGGGGAGGGVGGLGLFGGKDDMVEVGWLP